MNPFVASANKRNYEIQDFFYILQTGIKNFYSLHSPCYYSPDRAFCFILVKECRFATYRYAYSKAQGTVFLTLHWLKKKTAPLYHM